jgi:hypothetical protein
VHNIRADIEAALAESAVEVAIEHKIPENIIAPEQKEIMLAKMTTCRGACALVGSIIFTVFNLIAFALSFIITDV